MECILCGENDLEMLEMPKYNILVTGDRKIFRGRGIKKVICRHCGAIQHLQDENYRIQMANVFEEYETLYTKSFSPDGKAVIPRLQTIYQKISNVLRLSVKGNMLDVGCGGGESLMYFGQIYPDWNLYGMDIGEHFRQSVMEIEHVKGFFTTVEEVRKTEKKFDFISINYALCEVQNVVSILKMVNDILSDKGILFVIDTDFTVQPYVMNTVEASTFFEKGTLEALLRRTGFAIMDVDFVHEKKEVWAFAKKANSKQLENRYEINRQLYQENLNFLNRAVCRIEDIIKKNQRIGIWGMANAGVWVAEVIQNANHSNEKKIFFIEEDEEILGRKVGVNGFPICRAEDIGQEAVVFLPFPHYVAQNIKNRYMEKYKNLIFVCLD